jgi:1,4-dihydroxy-2-naphthoate polyprenyltransferase
MKIKSFFKLVEIQTKLASVVPFLLGSIYSLYHFKQFKMINFIIFFISLITFDMVTTTINNYFDYKKANKKSGYNYEKHNAIVRDNLSELSVLAIIFSLLLIASAAGFMLFLKTDIIVLLTGILCFGIGIFYSFGPVPISRTPFGEVFSGIFMGFIITFLSIYIHVFDQNIISFAVTNNIFTFNFKFDEIIYIILLSIPSVCGIANIMLANNICDMEVDIEDKRYTLPNFIGKKYSLFIFIILYLIAYIDLIVLSVLGFVSFFALASILTIIPVSKNVQAFLKIQTKKNTFSLAVKNFLMIAGSQVIIIGALFLINTIFNIKI